MPDVREHHRPKGEKRRATQKKSRFLRHAESNNAKIKNLKGKFTCDLEIYCFCSDFFTSLGKKTKKMARETGLEPATSTVTGWHSNQLSYSPAFISGVVRIETINRCQRCIIYHVPEKFQMVF